MLKMTLQEALSFLNDFYSIEDADGKVLKKAWRILKDEANKNPQEKINEILEMSFFPPNLKSESYQTTHDDNDGDPYSGILSLNISCDGDVWIKTNSNKMLRFRMPLIGGGRFPKIRNALLILAEAIRQEGFVQE